MTKIEIDTIGLDCPIPLVKLKEAVADSETGQVIEVKFSCPEAVRNLPNYANENNYEILEFDKLGTEGWKIVIKK